MHAPRWASWLGLAGVDHHENHRARRWHRRFEWFLIPLAVWLPLQWYLEVHGDLPLEEIRILDWTVWVAFALELVVVTLLADRPWRYVRHNWVSLVIVVAAFPLYWHNGAWIAIARSLRLFVLLSVVLRIAAFFRRVLGRNQLAPTLLAIFVITILAGVLVAAVDPQRFHTPGEGIWWAWETVTTVGYGDYVPSNWPGRVIAIFLMICGVCLIALLSATFAELFIAEEERRALSLRHDIINRLAEQIGEFDRATSDRVEILRQLERLNERLDRMEQRLGGTPPPTDV